MRIPLPVSVPEILAAGALIALPAALAPSRAAAQEPTVTVMVSQATSFDPSVQTAGIGSASVAAFWLDEPNEWGNPAALGTVRGIRYVHGETELNADDFEDIESDRVLAGATGIGISLAGKPLESIGGHRLDYGSRTLTDGFGTTLTFQPYEEVRSFSIGVSVLDLLSNVMSIGFRDRVTLAIGHTWKDLHADMGVDSTSFQPWHGEGESLDRGALVRIAPLDQIGEDIGEPRNGSAFRLELGAGYAERNYEDPADEDLARVPQREEIKGASARFTAAFPTRIGRGWFWDFATPTLAFAFAWERVEGEIPHVDGTAYDRTRSGGEVTVLDLLAFRHGRLSDASGLEGNTWGAGVSLRYRKAVGVRFDWARVPWGQGEEDLDRYEIAAFIDVLKFDTSGGLR